MSAGTAKSNKALVLGDNLSIDILNISKLYLGSTEILATADEMNTLSGLDTDISLSLVSYLDIEHEGVPELQKALITNENNELISLNINTTFNDK